MTDADYAPAPQGYTYQDLQNAGVTTPLFSNPLAGVEQNIQSFENDVESGFDNLSDGFKIALIAGIGFVVFSLYTNMKHK